MKKAGGFDWDAARHCPYQPKHELRKFAIRTRPSPCSTRDQAWRTSFRYCRVNRASCLMDEENIKHLGGAFSGLASSSSLSSLPSILTGRSGCDELDDESGWYSFGWQTKYTNVPGTQILSNGSGRTYCWVFCSGGDGGTALRQFKVRFASSHCKTLANGSRQTDLKLRSSIDRERGDFYWMQKTSTHHFTHKHSSR